MSMKAITKQLLLPLSVTVLCGSLVCVPALAGEHTGVSKRIEVYDVSQQYYDTRYGDTLSEILWQLLPNNPGKHAALQQEIIRLNPQAFINGNPDRLLAGKRLYLPGYLQKPDNRVDSGRYIIESYSWGNIKRPR